MSLNKTIIELPFKGVQTKVDPKLAPIGSYEKIDNMIMHRAPELIKRPGVPQIGISTTPSNITTSYTYLSEMGVIGTKGLFSYSSALDKFIQKGYMTAPVVSSDPIIANTYTQTTVTGDQTSTGIYGCIWSDSRGGVRCSVKDLTTDTFIQSDYLLDVTGVNPQVVCAGVYLNFLYVVPSTTTLTLVQYNTINNTFSSPNNISTIVGGGYIYDAVQALNNVLIAVVETTVSPDSIKAYYWNVNTQSLGAPINGLQSPTSLSFTNATPSTLCISLSLDPTGTYFACSIYNASKQIYTKTFFLFFTAITAELQVASATADSGQAITSTIDTANNTYIFYSSYSSIDKTYKAVVSGNTTSPAVASNALFYNQLSVISKAIWYSGNAYLMLSYTSTLQSTYFGVRDDGACWGRYFTLLGGGRCASVGQIGNISKYQLQSNTYHIPLLKTTKLLSSASSYFTTTSAFLLKCYFTPANIDNKQIAKYLNIAGGYLKQYDGSNTVFEQGYHLYPEQPVLTQSNGGGNLTTSGTYSYVVVWEWTDNQGQIIRSAPSIPATITLTGSNNTVAVVVNTLPITNKQTRFNDTRTNVVMSVYRTLTTGTTYYRVNPTVSTYVYNDPLANTIKFSDTIADTVISSNATLYTTGGVVQNIATPAANLLAQGKNRLYLAGVDTEPNKLFFSKEKEEGLGVEFSAELSVIVDSFGGDITAIAAMDDKVLIFKKSLLYYIAGQGPDKTAANGQFSVPFLVSADCGCNTPQSIVLTGLGVMFQSQKGIYLCDRQLNVTYLGSPLDHITTNMPNFLITSAANLPDQNLVYFTTNTNQVLVYDTYFGFWYTQSFNFMPTSSTTLTNSWYVTSSSGVHQSNPAIYLDTISDVITSTIKTNWINLNNIMGYGRIYEILLLGDNTSMAHKLVVNLRYDNEDFVFQTVTITPNSLVGPAYGADSPYGTGTPYGGSFSGSYNFVIRPMKQKCSSISIEIVDQFPGGDRTASFKFTGIALVVGIKQGYNKNLSYTRRLT
jgi:hypothetical protein